MSLKLAICCFKDIYSGAEICIVYVASTRISAI